MKNKDNIVFRKIRAACLILLAIAAGFSVYSALIRYAPYFGKERPNYPYFNGVPFQKGMAFTTWGTYSYNSSEVYKELDKMKANNIEWVAFTVWWIQDNLTSTEIKFFNWSATEEELLDTFTYAHSLGLKIMFKPMLDSATGQWRSNIEASDEWFASYTDFMVNMSKIAARGNVEILSIGCEMGNMQVREDKVRDMIGSIRAVYNGMLTYAANHDSFWFITWWDAVDIIGIDAWFPFTLEYEPTIEDLVDVWNGFYDRLELFSLKWNRPILFTEAGAQARDGTNMIPNDNKFNDNRDIIELRMIYESLFKSRIWTAPWFKGVYWWIWDTSEPGAEATGFVPKAPEVLNLINTVYGISRKADFLPVGSIPTIAAASFLGVLSLYSSYFVLKRAGTDVGSNTRRRKILSPETRSDLRIGMEWGAFISFIMLYYLPYFYSALYTDFTFSYFLGISSALRYVVIFGVLFSGIIIGGVLFRSEIRIRRNKKEMQSAALFGMLLLIVPILPFVVSSSPEEFGLVSAVFIAVMPIWCVVMIFRFARRDIDKGRVGIILITFAGFIILCGMFAYLSDYAPLFIILLPYAIPSTSVYCDIEEGYIGIEKKAGRFGPEPSGLFTVFTDFATAMIISSFTAGFNLINMNILPTAAYILRGIAATVPVIFGIWMSPSGIPQPGRGLTDNSESTERSGKLKPHERYGLLGFLISTMAAILHPLISEIPIIYVLGGTAIILIILMNISVLSNSYRKYPFGAWRLLLYIVFSVTIGFTLNGIKGSLIYVLSFIEIVNGKPVVRTDFSKRLPYDVPTLIYSLVVGGGVLLFIIGSLTAYFLSKLRIFIIKNRKKKE